MSYFKNDTIKKIVHYRWLIARGYIITRFFLPFIVFGYIPYMVFAVLVCSFDPN